MKARRINEHDWDEERYLNKRLIEDLHWDDEDDDFDDEDDDEEEGPFTKRDGWDKGALREVGLIDWLDDVQRIQYEVLNGRRGSYAVSGNTGKDLMNDLVGLYEQLNDVIENMTDELE